MQLLNDKKNEELDQNLAVQILHRGVGIWYGTCMVPMQQDIALSTVWIRLGLHRVELSTKSTCHNISTKGFYNISLIYDFSTEIAYINK